MSRRIVGLIGGVIVIGFVVWMVLRVARERLAMRPARGRGGATQFKWRAVMNAEQVWGLVRTGLAAVAGGWAAKKGIDGETVNAILGGLGTLFVAGWSIFSNRKNRKVS